MNLKFIWLNGLLFALLSSGGLGIRKISLFNIALLRKGLWRFGIEKDALWRKVIELKYGCLWGGWCSRSVNGPFGVALWKSISQGWPSFSHHILYDIGDGSRVKFGKTIGVVRLPLWLVSLVCSDFAGIRRLVWLSL